MPFDVFISHSSEDKQAADATCAALEAAGIRCWIAPRDVRPGFEYGAEIIKSIDMCRVMVLLFSSNANQSRQIHREIERAVSKGVTIIPVCIENVVPTQSMEYFLGGIHWLDALTPPFVEHLHQISQTVKAILQAGQEAAPPTENAGPLLKPKLTEKTESNVLFKHVALPVTAAFSLVAVVLIGWFVISPLIEGYHQAGLKTAEAANPSPSTPLPTGQVASNEDILKNIVLASNDEPLNFPSVRRDSSFMEGFLKPVDLQTLDSFIRLGYSRELLFWLFTDSVEITYKGQTSGTRYNPPEDYGCIRGDPKKRCFSDFILVLVAAGMTVEQRILQKMSTSGSSPSGGKPITVVFSRFCFKPAFALRAANAMGEALYFEVTHKYADLPTSAFSQSATTPHGTLLWTPKKHSPTHSTS